MDALRNVQSMEIREKVQWLEAVSAVIGQEFEMANKYSVHDKQSGNQLFYAAEATDCLTRQAKQCLPDCAAWSVEIMWTGDGGASKVLHMERPWTLTCCCFNRPKVTILDSTSNQEIGDISDPCNMCGMDLAATTPDGDKIFSANGGCCQLGTICPMPCGPCSKVEYEIQDASGAAIGMLTKKVPGICKFFLSPDVDNYILEFDQGSEVWQDPMNKAMMIGMALFMDFRYFSENPNDDDGGLMGGAGDMFGGE